ncbi:MAG: hypothetical protein NTW20_07170 [Rhodobacterales bacterium]|nr:hypothetical protein [Rhodobacterales bacterium]
MIITQEFDLEFFTEAAMGRSLDKWRSKDASSTFSHPFTISFPSYLPPLVISPSAGSCPPGSREAPRILTFRNGTDTVHSLIVATTYAVDNSDFTHSVILGAPFIVRTADTGSFVMASIMPAVPSTAGDARHQFLKVPMFKPNQIPAPKAPKDQSTIPSDMPSILVDCGLIDLKGGSKGVVLHEQYWRVGPNSFVLLPGQQKTISSEQVSGVTDESTSHESLSESLDLSVGGGWGPISASISASLSHSSDTSHTRRLQSQTRNQVEDMVANADVSKSINVFFWELVDRYVVIDPAKSKSAERVLGIVESVKSPPLLGVSPVDAKFVSLYNNS